GRRDGQGQLALRALDGDVLAVDGGGHAVRDGDGVLADTRHFSLSPLPDVGEDFPAHLLLGGLTVGQQALARGADVHAQAAEDVRQVGGLRVHAQTRLRHAADAGDRTLTGRAVLEVQGQSLADLGVFDGVVLDVALLLEDSGDVRLELGRRHRDGVVVRV